jgi:hypothetical protein
VFSKPVRAQVLSVDASTGRLFAATGWRAAAVEAVWEERADRNIARRMSLALTR